MPLLKDYRELWAMEEPGGYLWSTTLCHPSTCGEVEHGGHETLVLAVPDILHGKKFECVRLYMERSEDDWAKPGSIYAFSGTKERPTLTPSIQVLGTVDGQEVNGWHGFLQDGELVNV